AANQQLLEIVWLRIRSHDSRGDTTTAIYLPSAVGKFHFRLHRWLRIVVIIVKRDVVVIALDQTATRCVVARRRQQQSSVFAERKLGLHQALAETCFPYDQSPIVILNGAR